jgi:hypothetical protein
LKYRRVSAASCNRRTLRTVALLGRFEVVQRVKERKQPHIGLGLEADEVGRVNDKHAVKRESGRLRVDVADAGKEQGRHGLSVRHAGAELPHDGFRATLARRALD